MATSSEEISKYYSNSGGKPDSNLANDALHLGGIPAEDYATQKYVRDYHNNKESLLRDEINQQDTNVLNNAKAYTDFVVNNQDFSGFAKLTDIQALNQNISNEIIRNANEQKGYTDTKVQAVVNDVNANFDDVNDAINTLNGTTRELFQSVSNGKSIIAGAITDKGVATSASDTFSTMATNIRNIPTDGGGGVIPPGYIDTSDATAIANDIVLNKTAYANGEKMVGTLITPQYYEENNDNPYPETVAVDLIYGAEDGNLEETNLSTNVPSNLYAISADKRILVEYDATNQKIITKRKTGNGYFVERDARTDELITPEYTLEQLGITMNEDLSVSSIVFSPMNTKESFSGYECNLAIAVKRTSNNISDEDIYSYYVYVFVMNTFKGEMPINDEVGEGYTKVNKYVITSERKSVQNGLPICFSSSDSQLLLIADNYRGNYSSQTAKFITVDLYKYKYNSISYMVKLSEDVAANNWNNCRIKFLNDSRVIQCCIRQYAGSTTIISVLNENGTAIIKNSVYSGGSGSDAATGTPLELTYDCLHAIKGDCKFYDVVINYETGDVTLSETTGIAVVDGYYDGGNANTFYFDKSGKYLFAHGYPGMANFDVYAIDDFETTSKLTKLLTYSMNFSINFLPDLRTILTTRNNVINFYSPRESKELIGLRYNGQMFYSDIYKSSKLLTATQEDVRAGKKFIGVDGVPETGTMEVNENE